jgi:hypothetical protein
MSPPNAKVQKLANDLVGTCGMGEVQDRLNDLSEDECHQLDMVAFCCCECEYWHPRTDFVETLEGWFCKECRVDG